MMTNINSFVEKYGEKGIRLLLAFCFASGMAFHFSQGEVFALNSMWNLFAVPFAYILLGKWKELERRLLFYGSLFGGLFSLAIVLGDIIYLDNHIFALFHPVSNLGKAGLRFLGLASVLCVAAGFLYKWMLTVVAAAKGSNNYCGKLKLADGKFGKLMGAHPVCKRMVQFILTWAAILISFIPAYRAYFPGTNRYDFSEQARQAIAGISEYTKLHPPLHTYLISKAIDYGNRTGTLAITIYAKVQMVIMAAVLAMALVYLLIRKVKPIIAVLAYSFVICNPVIAIFSIIPVKDACFAACFLLLSVLLWELAVNTEKCLKNPLYYAGYSMVALFCCLFRNNAKYALLLAVPFLLLAYRKYWKRVLILALIPFLLFALVDKGIYTKVLKIQNGSNAEMLSVPMMQMADIVTINGKELPPEVLEVLDYYLPLEELPELYSPRDADPIKVKFKTDHYNESPMKFWKDWAKLGIRYPGCYISAFLSLNIPYWYPDADTLDEYSQREYIEVTDVWQDRSETTLAPKLLEKYERVASYEAMEGVPFVNNLFSITTPIWLLLLTLAGLLVKRQYKMIQTIVPAMFLWLTHIAGPLSNFRYMFPIFLLYPVLLAMFLDVPEATDGEA